MKRTHRQLPGKVPIILVQKKRLSRKMTYREPPGKMPIVLVEKRRLFRSMTHTASRLGANHPCCAEKE